MKLKVQQVLDATLVLAQIIREVRPMPQRGKFRVARMHAKLLPEFTTANAQRDAMIREHGDRQTETVINQETGESTVSDTDRWMVPLDRMPEFNAAWQPVADTEIDVDVEPLRLSELDCGNGNGGIEASELIALGDLVVE